MEKVVVDEEAKIVIPAHVLSRRGLRPGDELLLVEVTEGLLLYRRGAEATTAREGETDRPSEPKTNG